MNTGNFIAGSAAQLPPSCGGPMGGASKPSTTSTHPGDTPFELRFVSLFDPGKGLTFPCDRHGQVDLDALSERARCNYFAARATVGRDYAFPAVLLRPPAYAGSAASLN